MSAKDQDRARTLAERIANRLAQDERPEHVPTRSDSAAAGHVGDELAALRAGLSEIGQRLTKIESHVVTTTTNSPRATERTDSSAVHGQQPSQTRATQNERSPSSHSSDSPQRFLSSTYVPAVHPSEERFGIDEAVSELVEFFEREKVCNVEPGGKPCDHCGMCSSRGF